jgi:hypothetical protein
VRGVTLLPRQVTAGVAVKKIVTKEKTLLLYPCELLKVRNGCIIGMYRCTVNVGVYRMLCFRALLCPADDTKISEFL